MSAKQAAQLAALLDQTHRCLTAFVAFPSPAAADAVTVYDAVTHAQHELQVAPRLVITSAMKRCGKSRLLTVSRLLVANALPAASISAAALTRSITRDNPPVIILDEADTTFGKALRNDEKAEHLRGIINAGFERGWDYVRWDVTARKPEKCPTFAMAILAGIGTLPDTITDRAINLVMKRRGPGERVEKYRTRRDNPRVADLGLRLGDAIGPLAEKIGTAEPEMPGGLHDRAEDCWEPLIALGDLAGDQWGVRIRVAAVELTAAADQAAADEDLLMRLLTDTCRSFYLDAEGKRLAAPHDELGTVDLIERMCGQPEAPWARVGRKGEQIDGNWLANRLRPFGVGPGQVRVGGKNTRGYRRAHLDPVWVRHEITLAVTEDALCGTCGEPLTEADVLAGATTHVGCAGGTL